MRSARILLEIRGLTKRFTGTLALDRVDFDVAGGEIHALLGENGAGKSTLIKILAGVHTADAGAVYLRGQQVRPATQRLPMSFIHQDLALVDSMTVAENIAMVAGYPKRRSLISWSKVREQAYKALKTLGSDIDPDVEVRTLPAAEKSMIAIARAIALDCDLLVLDEPTATLPNSEVNRLFTVLRRLRDAGLGMIYVTHRLDEVFQLADRVTVLRDGRMISSRSVREVTPNQLVTDIVGREVKSVFAAPGKPNPAVALELRSVRVGAVGPVSLRIPRGEILGLVGLVGAGHHVIGRALVGDVPVTSGEVCLDSKVVSLINPRAALHNGIGFLSSKRAEESLLTTLTVRENLYPNPTLVGAHLYSWIWPSDEAARSMKLIRQFSIRPQQPDRPISTLSGGNQQKVALARAMQAGRRALVLEEPTFGVDVGAKADIYALMRDVAAQGRVILMVSSDFEEVALVCHRAVVFHRGRIVGELLREQLSVDRLTGLAVGAA